MKAERKIVEGTKQRPKLKICLLSDYSGHSDEGVRKITFYLMQELSKYHEIKAFDLKSALSPKFWREIKDFCPQLIHSIPGPTIFTFIIMKALKFYCPNSKIVMSATHPNFYDIHSIFHGPSFVFSWLFQNFIFLLKPDLLLVQSHETEEMFRRKNLQTEFLPNGIDLEKFCPISPEVKAKLREKYGISPDKFVILHAGAIKKLRNIQILEKLQKGNDQVIILGSTSLHMEQDVYHDLEQRGCLVWRRYFDNVWEIFAMSDCYIFPVVDKAGSVEMPLSVLEAMACNLPVITTRFGALPGVFNGCDGLFFVKDEDEFTSILEIIKNSHLAIKTREKVMPYSWEGIGKKIERIYFRILGEVNEN